MPEIYQFTLSGDMERGEISHNTYFYLLTVFPNFAIHLKTG